MCGIAGYIHKGLCSSNCIQIEENIHTLQACRGPDAQNSIRLQAEGTVFHLFHQRLRIQDLTSGADQPMRSSINPDCYTVFNGEIYNMNELKANFLTSLSFKTSSDTEVLLESLTSVGLSRVLEDVRGMFAFGLLEIDLGHLTLVRDRFGEKPLNYWIDGKNLVFASNYNAVSSAMRILGVELSFNQDSIFNYLALGYFPYENSLVKGISKVEPGGIVRFETKNENISIFEKRRWFPKWITSENFGFSSENLHSAIESAVREQLIGDVPIGVFLSGGVDSTLVSAIAQKISPSKIHSFSVGFEHSDFDESIYASRAAKEIGTHHHNLTMKSADAIEILPYVLKAFSEPLGDPSVFPTTFISRAARETVTVALTGDGADELFFGYGRYSRFLELQRFDRVISNRVLERSLFSFLQFLEDFSRKSRFGRLRYGLSGTSPASVYLSLVGFPHLNPCLDQNSYENAKREIEKRLWSRGNSAKNINRLREVDIDSYLCDDILVKVDHSAMAFGLETRAPFLDYRVQKLASRANESLLKTHENKAVLKDILSKYVSSEIFRRPKMGFGAPMGDWFRSTLFDWSLETIRTTNWNQVGLQDSFVKSIFDSVISGNNQSSTYLWSLLALGHATKEFH